MKRKSTSSLEDEVEEEGGTSNTPSSIITGRKKSFLGDNSRKESPTSIEGNRERDKYSRGREIE